MMLSLHWLTPRQDIRHPFDDPTPPVSFMDYLNQPSVQEALGVAINYTQDANDEIYFAFQQTGDFVYQSLLEDLEAILNSGVRVSLIYGDADYICNWFGGQAISMELNYTHSAQFRKAGYTPMTADGKQWGETKEYGNFSFTRVYEAGHEVPYYQPQAALALFNRTINGMDIATGKKKITADLETSGSKTATHTESFVALPTSTGS
jgi:carboxypeptidase C (cathepsin A)